MTTHDKAVKGPAATAIVSAAAQNDSLSQLVEVHGPALAKNDSSSHSAEAHVAINLADLSALTGFAINLGLELSGSIEERADTAAMHMSRSQRHMLASGVLLASIKAECQHGQFLALIEERGFAPRTAQRAMQYAEFVLSRPQTERQRLVGMEPSKVLLLASADPEVIESMLADGGERIDGLTVAQLRARIGEQDKVVSDLRTEVEAGEHDRNTLRRQLESGLKSKDGDVPPVVSVMRQRSAELSERALLVAQDMHELLLQFKKLAGENAAAAAWADPSLRLLLSGVAHAATQIDGVLNACLQELPEGSRQPVSQSALLTKEVVALGKRFGELTALRSVEAHRHDVRVANATRVGPGRPLKEPELPATAKARKPRYDAKGRK